MDSPAELAAKQLAWQLETQTSVNLEVTTTITAFSDKASKTPEFTSTEDHYIETAAGQRFLEFRGMKSGLAVTRSSHYGEGGRFTDVNYRLNDTGVQESVFITNHFWMEDASERRQVPSPLLHFYVGRKPLHQALPKAQYLGISKCLDRDCDIFLFPQVRWFVTQDQVYYLDKKTSVPLKIEVFRDEASRNKQQPMAVWVAKTLDSAEGHNFPLRSSETAYGKDGNREFLWDFDVKRIHFNEEYPDSTFRPVLQPGVLVLDATTKKSYKVPGVVVIPPQVSVPGQAVRATPPPDRSSYVSTGSLLLGVGLILVAGFAWWRRH